MDGSAVIERCRYGGTSVWVARGALGGSEAHRLADRVRLHFRAEQAPLVLDVRGLDQVDDCGLRALARCREEHPGFRVIGRPLGWPTLPLGLRLGLDGISAGPDLATTLERAAARRSAAAARPAGVQQRRHPRVPVGIPVEIILGGRTAPATLEELSRGGLRLGRLTESCAAALAAEPHPRFEVVGLDADPFAREVLGPAASGPVAAVPVYLLAAARVGARFAESRPPL